MEQLWRWGPGFFLAVTSSGEQTTGKCSWSHCTALSASAFWVFGLNRWGWGEVFLNTIFVLRQSISMCVFPFGLQCFILLLLGPQCWDYKCIPPQTVGMAMNTVSLASRLLSGYRRKRHKPLYLVFFEHLGKHCPGWATSPASHISQAFPASWHCSMTPETVTCENCR